jgi:hypothetical protein
MPTKTTSDGRPYEIDGKRLTWHPEDDDGQRGNLPDVVLPLRLKMGLVLDLAEREMDNAVMYEMLTRLVPERFHDTMREMDVNDFQDMFTTWQSEYNTLSGASLGESGASASSSSSTEAPLSSISASGSN